MTTQHLRCFLAVVDELSFTRAAERLHLSPSTVSEQIASLERRLGVTLFVRTSRSVACTNAATALSPLARRAVESMDEVVAWAAGPETGAAVRIGMLASSTLLRAVVEAARATKPGVDWKLRQLPFTSPDQHLLRGELDCAFVAGLRPATPRDGIATYDLWTERLVLAVREDHPLTRRPRAMMSDLAGITLICGPNGPRNPQWFATIEALVPGQPRVLADATNLEEAVEMAATGLGGTVVAESAIEMFPRPGIAFVPLADAPLATMRLHTRAQDPSRALAHLVATALERHPTSASRVGPRRP
nr:LysR substrate-binding domain-containing protein [Nocardioides luti]